MLKGLGFRAETRGIRDGFGTIFPAVRERRELRRGFPISRSGAGMTGDLGETRRLNGGRSFHSLLHFRWNVAALPAPIGEWSGWIISAIFLSESGERITRTLVGRHSS